MNYTVKNRAYQGIIHIPPSKSDSQRALLIAALGSGRSVLHNIGSSEDERAMIENIRKLGAVVDWLDNKTVAVSGDFDRVEISELHCGESGLGVRLLTSVAALKPNTVTLKGSGSLAKRNQSFFERFLPGMGVQVVSNEGKLPISVTGPLKPGSYSVDGSESSQYISGLLIAFSRVVAGTTRLKAEHCTSKPYIDMTIHTLKRFGVQVDEVENAVYEIKGMQPVLQTDYTIDGDWSSASCWLVAAALGMAISVKGLSMSSRQADKAILNTFMTAGCRVMDTESGLYIDGKDRKPLDFDAANCPDLFPALVAYASLTEGVSRIKGVHRLANKESDRGEALRQEFGKLGIHIRVEDDTMLVEGKDTIRPATVFSHNDHRIAMCLAIASAAGKVEITIEGAEAVAKSYPQFWEDLERLTP